jgi:hypothetical protein
MKTTLALAVLAWAYAAWLPQVRQLRLKAPGCVRVVSQSEARLCIPEKSGGARRSSSLHGGPDFDHSYLVPELDRICDSFHLIYYDQRGRGGSADRVLPEDVTLASNIADLEKVRQYFHLDIGGVAGALLGHCARP